MYKSSINPLSNELSRGSIELVVAVDQGVLVNVKSRGRLGKVVIGLLKGPHHLDELLSAVLRHLLRVDDKGPHELLAGHQRPEVFPDIIVKEDDPVRLPKMGLQPFTMPVRVIVLCEGSLERSDIEDGAGAFAVQPVPDVLKVFGELLPVIDEVLPAVDLYRLIDQQMRLIENGAEVLDPVPLSAPQLFQSLLRIGCCIPGADQPADNRHPDQRLVESQLPRDPPQF